MLGLSRETLSNIKKVKQKKKNKKKASDIKNSLTKGIGAKDKKKKGSNIGSNFKGAYGGK